MDVLLYIRVLDEQAPNSPRFTRLAYILARVLARTIRILRILIVLARTRARTYARFASLCRTSSRPPAHIVLKIDSRGVAGLGWAKDSSVAEGRLGLHFGVAS